MLERGAACWELCCNTEQGVRNLALSPGSCVTFSKFLSLSEPQCPLGHRLLGGWTERCSTGQKAVVAEGGLRVQVSLQARGWGILHGRCGPAVLPSPDQDSAFGLQAQTPATQPTGALTRPQPHSGILPSALCNVQKRVWCCQNPASRPDSDSLGQ